MADTHDLDKLNKHFTHYINDGFKRIYASQRLIAKAKIYSHPAYRSDNFSRRSRSGALQRALESPQYTLTGAGISLSAKAQYPKYLRFLDMKRLGNYFIYNRPIWGILYRETFKNIRFKYYETSQEILANAMTESYMNS